jgi:flagellar biosynthesis protein FlhA
MQLEEKTEEAYKEGHAFHDPVEQLKQRSPKIVEETIPGVLKPVELQKLLQNLLRERVPVRDLETILETVAEWGSKTKDLDVLTEYVRNSLRRTICQQVSSPDPATGASRVSCVTIDPTLEEIVQSHIDRGPGGTSITMPSRMAQAIGQQIAAGLAILTSRGSLPVIVASPPVRAVIRQLVEPHVPGVVVLGYNEVVQGIEVESVALISPPAGLMQTQVA